MIIFFTRPGPRNQRKDAPVQQIRNQTVILVHCTRLLPLLASTVQLPTALDLSLIASFLVPVCGVFRLNVGYESVDGMFIREFICFLFSLWRLRFDDPI
ncbi:hypothetical protein KY284_000880 [Solanum tuberosum]|nr:hypothetical protein KY284_000880 [Solanum tuberosum]